MFDDTLLVNFFLHRIVIEKKNIIYFMCFIPEINNVGRHSSFMKNISIGSV